MENILLVEDLSKTFIQKGKTFYAVDHVSFHLASGEILGIVGESGSGKSTIARLVTRLLDASSGKIILDGQDITSLKGHQLIPVYKKMQMVFQTPASSFDPRRTLGYGIGESLKNTGADSHTVESKCRELLEQCGLPGDFVNRYPHEVSGGQCQRAAIARALVNEPELLILDEATSALDVTVQKQIIELLQKLKKERSLSYLFICHNLALVQQFCDRVLVLNEGKIVEQGTVDEVILHPQDEYTRRLIDSVF